MTAWLRKLLPFLLLGALGSVWAQTTVTCSITTQNLNPSGVATAGSSCEIPTQGMSVVGIQVTGTYTGALSGQVTTNLTNYLTWGAATAFTPDTTGATTATIGSGVQDGFVATVAGKSSFRLTALGAVTGTATVTLRSSLNGGSVGGGVVPLPAGSATAARQDTGNTSLASIDSKAPALGQALAAASVPVILPAATVTTLTPPAAITGFATAAKQPALGTAGAASADVISVQGIAGGTVLPISAASLPTHAVTVASGGVASGALASGSVASGAMIDLGAQADAAAAADNSTASLIALIKRTNQRLTQVDTDVVAPNTQLPAALGQTNKAGSLSVGLASDQMTTTANADANRLPVSLTIASPVTGSNAASGNVVSMTVGRDAACVIVDVTSYTAGTHNFEFGDGVVTPYSVSGFTLVSNGGSGGVTSITGAGQWKVPVQGTVFQVRQSTAGAGATMTLMPVAAQCPTITATNIGNNSITTAGTGATGATIFGNGFRITARGSTANPTAVTDGQTQEITMDTVGHPVVLPYAIPQLTWQATSGTTALTTSTSTQVQAAAAGARHYVTSCDFANNSGTVSTVFSILDNATAIFTGFLPATTAALSLVSLRFSGPVPLRGSINTQLNVQAVTTGASVFWNCQGFDGP